MKSSERLENTLGCVCKGLTALSVCGFFAGVFSQ